VEIDGHPVGAGKPGPVVARLRELYIEEMRKVAV
jgi:D-alanine transaminase